MVDPFKEGKRKMAKYRFDEIESQADLDRLIREVKENSSNNYSQASERTQRKIENLEGQIQRLNEELDEQEKEFNSVYEELTSEMKEYESALDEAYSANDTYELTDMLNEAGIDPRFHELVINNGGLTSAMEEEEFMDSIGGVLERYPEFGLNQESVLAERFEDTPDAEFESEEQQQPEYIRHTNQ